ncbi:hypothetical protein JDV02_004351 [Purpureocillium takamizusanense]|uniref:Small secreted protein n=1 Tax=Purpureocillium takamizusanense TaxID=2060973 RepID=A0A9Q8QE94_9HYPO|nr:uncharacterized protein JDV02_004351 [Purpureocillium takamizusanense]UNI18055.1 hypothetical protein JDV02_004351 [Purpureocillium takamizusanense]
MLRFINLLIVALASVALGQQHWPYKPPTNGDELVLTAITAADGNSIFECWRLDAIFRPPPGAPADGAVGVPLGNVSSASYNIIPADFNGGLHNAPSRQFVLFASGHVRVKLPNSTDELWITGGNEGLIIAADTADVSRYGHIITTDPGEVVASLQMPLAHGLDFEHEVVHPGPCNK